MKKIISFEEMVQIAKARGKKTLVLVTGCFDLLHQAHHAFLNAAKKKGDLLIVGLEQDQRVRELKGTGRPVQNWPKRAENLAELESVDYIFALPVDFSRSEDHERLIAKLRPDILAVSENTPFIDKKEKIVEKYDGKVLVVLPFNPTLSTTKLLKNFAS